jgi:hypothetical protein
VSDYEKAMTHVELALRRTANLFGGDLRDALFVVAEELAGLAEEARKTSAVTSHQLGPRGE